MVRASWAAAALVAVGHVLQAQSSPPVAAPTQTPIRQNPSQVIRRSFNLVSTDVVVRDAAGRFIPDLKKQDFEVYEDGVKQEIVSFIVTVGGHIYNEVLPPMTPGMEGIILPAAKPPRDVTGRVFVIFIDDLHLDFSHTGQVRALFRQISKELIHEGDMFAIVSTGTSSIAINPTYDRKQLAAAEKKIAGSSLAPNEILSAPLGANGLAEVNYRAHVAFATANDMLQQLEQMHNRRKALIYLSNGYDLNPFRETREKNDKERSAAIARGNDDSANADHNADPFGKQGNRFSEADLAAQLGEVIRAANRANASIYTIDSRGLVGMPNLSQNINMVEWQNYLTTSQNTLRTLAEGTGGFAIVNQNDYTKGLRRIDAETSDYYMVGYYSSNPDPLKRRRTIEVKVARKDATAEWRKEYSLKPLPRD